MVALALLLGGMALAVGVFAPAGAQAFDDAPGTVASFESALDSADIPASLARFADDAVVIQPRIAGLPEIYVGREEIRWWLRAMIAQHASLRPLGELQTDGARVRWSDGLSADAFRQLGLDVVDVDSDAVVGPDGRIAWLRMELTPEAARRIEGAPVTPL